METDKTIEEQIKEKVQAAKPEIVAKATEQAISALQMQLSWHVESQLKELVSEVFEKEILPELREAVLAQKQTIITGLLDGITDVGVEVSKALVAKAVENLQQSWNVSKLAEDLFK